MTGLLVLAAICAVFCSVFLFFVVRAYRSLKWPKTPATIIESGVKEKWVMINNMPIRTFQLDILYEYSFNGRSYTSKRLGSQDDSHPEEDKVRTMQRNFPQGGKIHVRVNPENPKMALLKAGVSTGLLVATWVFGSAALILLLFAVFNSAGAQQPY